MRCRQCGQECVLQTSQSDIVGDNTYQVSRTYKCSKCGKKFTVTDDPIQIEAKI